MKAFTPEQKQIDRTLSLALVKGGQDARKTLARLLRTHKHDKPTNTNTMTTQTAPKRPTNSLAIVPYGNQWQAIKVRQEPTLDEIIAKVCRQLEAIETQIDTINNQLRNL